MLPSRWCMALAAASLLCATAAAQTASGYSFKVIHALTAVDGGGPIGPLISDAAGNFYGAEVGGVSAFSVGAVFRLNRPAPGKTTWTFKILHGFGGQTDGSFPDANLIADSAGNLYGTTRANGGGLVGPTVFRLSPPKAGTTTWTETILHNFTGIPDGDYITAPLIFDPAGNLYGTSQLGGVSGAGTVFRVAPPPAGKTAWTETVLYSFTGKADGSNPYAGLVIDKAGNLYGTTDRGGAKNDGTVFELSPPAAGESAWTETVLYSFKGGTDGLRPESALVFDGKGNLYGATSGSAAPLGGTIFRLAPPAPGKTGWRKSLLHTLLPAEGQIPLSALVLDKTGNLYGTASLGGGLNFGTVFKLTHPSVAGSTWTASVLHSFAKKDGIYPGGLLMDAVGNLYGTTWGGGLGHGTIYELSPQS